MCGIAGIVGPAAGGETARPAIRHMTDVLHSRGPDDEGHWSSDSAVLGHRRLAIVDIEGGAQPFLIGDAGHQHAFIYNGELYGASMLRSRLRGRGVAFRSRSDTEVALRTLVACRDPRQALASLTGMFALAWWDAERRRLLLARDRVGIKPLYYSRLPDSSLVFGSSVAAVVASGITTLRADPAEVGHFLTFGFTGSPSTLFADVKELPPGHFLEWESGHSTVHRWWGVDWSDEFEGSEEEAAEEFDGLFSEVVREHLVADVPIAAFLSGGLDSSAVVARAARTHDDLLALTVAVPGSDFDESRVAARTAAHLGVMHEVVPIEALRIDPSSAELIVNELGLPFADSSALPTYLVSKAATQHAKVVLSGDGGDELFAGYETFRWLRTIGSLSRAPMPMRRALLRGVAHTGTLAPRSNRLRQLRRALNYSLEPRDERLLLLKSILDPSDLANVVPTMQAGIPGLERVRRMLADAGPLSDTRALSRFLFEHSLPGDMLRKVDAMSMAVSLEVRVPLLDHRLVEFAQKLPDSMKIKGATSKALFRRVTSKELPREVIEGPKRGFSIPLRKAMTPDLLEYARDTIGSEASHVSPIADASTCNTLIKAIRDPQAIRPSQWSDYTTAHALWILIQLETWARKYRIDLSVS